jgi:hypothetical protein
MHTSNQSLAFTLAGLWDGSWEEPELPNSWGSSVNSSPSLLGHTKRLL